MKESKLYQALKSFPGANGNESNLAKEFEKVAKAVLFSGHFCINRDTNLEFNIEPTCIEFYYHEDDNNVKDEKKHLKGKSEFNYPLGAIMPHSAGVDVLFDNREEKFHASFLIRGYRAIEKNGDSYVNADKNNRYWKSLDLWYDLFGNSNMLNAVKFSIEWIDNGKPEPIEGDVFTMERIKDQKGFGDKREWAYYKRDQIILTENQKDKVYFSDWFRCDYPKLYTQLTNILDNHKVVYGTLPSTADYWCRDYMPIQWGVGRYAQFLYKPDYLDGKEKYLTDTDKVMKKLDEPVYILNRPAVRNKPEDKEKFTLKIDGGSLSFCELNQYEKFVVLTEKVRMDNAPLSREKIEAGITAGLGMYGAPEFKLRFVWLPWDSKSDEYGHTDGLLRYIDHKNGKPRILVNLKVYGEKYAKDVREELKKYFELIELELSHYDELSWAYINMLQTRDVIIVPGIGDEVTDKEALEQVKLLFPQYGERIYQIQAKDFIVGRKGNGGGAFNCCTWTIKAE